MRDWRNDPPEPDPRRASAVPPDAGRDAWRSWRPPANEDYADGDAPPLPSHPGRWKFRADGSRRTLGDVPQSTSPSHRLPAVVPRGGVPVERREPGALIPAGSMRAPVMRAADTRARALPGRAGRRLITSAAVVLTLTGSLVVGAWHALGAGTAGADARPGARGTPQADGTPPPSGSLPAGVWVASAAVVVYLPPPPKPTPSTANTNSGGGIDFGIQPCHDPIVFPTNISQWTVPTGCYADVYVPNPANYPPRPTFGYCNWWVRENHLSNYNITMGSQVYLGTTPAPGDAIFFDGGVQGASAEGHWAQVVAVAPDHYWFLLSEMNFAWRGAGFGKIDYRFAHVGPGVGFYN